MSQTLWLSLELVAGAGALGGIVNALMTDNGFIIPRRDEAATSQGNAATGIWRPGFITNVVIGAAAALLSWGLYGPASSYDLFGPAATNPSLTISALAGAMLVGIGGTRWITNETDKKLLRATAATLAATPSDGPTAATVALSSPSAGLRAAQQLMGATSTPAPQSQAQPPNGDGIPSEASAPLYVLDQGAGPTDHDLDQTDHPS